MRRADAYGVHAFDCPHCGERIDNANHPLEVTIVFALLAWIVAVVGVFILAPEWSRIAILVGPIPVVAALALVWRVRGQSSRYRVVRPTL